MRGYGLTSRSSPVRRFEPREERRRCCRRRRRCRDPADRARCSRAPRRRGCRAPARAAAAATAAAAAAAAPAAEVRVARHADRAAVLLRAADVIRHVRRRDDVVELRRRDSPAPVQRLRRRRVDTAPPPSLPMHEVLRVVGIDPEVVMVAVRAAERPSASCRRRSSGTALDVQHVDDVSRSSGRR